MLKFANFKSVWGVWWSGCGVATVWQRNGQGSILRGVGFQRSYGTESARYGGLAECSRSGKFEIELFGLLILARRHMVSALQCHSKLNVA